VRREAWQDKAPRLTGKVTVSDIARLAARAATLDPPAQLSPPPSLAAALALRLSEAPERIATDDAGSPADLRAAFPSIGIQYQAASDWPFDLDAAFDEALAPSLAFSDGGSVHFAETRTATMIDVDTGTHGTGSPERAALAANRAAALLIARQLRLRNIGGGVVIDFVGLDRRDQRERVRRTLETALAADPAKPQLLGWTRLGHVELVRPRRARSLADAMLEQRGVALQPLARAYEALRRLLREARANPAANWRLAAAPAIEAALRGPAAAALGALEARLGRRITITIDPGRDGFDIIAI
jgi:ribonuclease G